MKLRNKILIGLGIIVLILFILDFSGCFEKPVIVDTETTVDTVYTTTYVTREVIDTFYLKGSTRYVNIEVPVKDTGFINRDTNSVVTHYQDDLLSITDSIVVSDNFVQEQFRTIELDTPVIVKDNYVYRTDTVTINKTTTNTIVKARKGFYIAISGAIDPVPDRSINERMFLGIEPEIGYTASNGWDFGLVKSMNCLECFEVRIAVPLARKKGK